MSPAAKGHLSRIVSRAPEAMFKVTGRARGGAVGLKAQLDYITHNAKLFGETHDGRRDQCRASYRPAKRGIGCIIQSGAESPSGLGP
jgi:hypothetical protein